MDAGVVVRPRRAGPPPCHVTDATRTIASVRVARGGVVAEGGRPGDKRADFVGREAELALLSGVLDAAVAGRGAVVLVSGEAGIGKSRLATEIEEGARARGFTTAWGRAWEAGGAPPFWPWTRALRTVLAELGDAPLAGLDAAVKGRLAAVLPEIGSAPEGGTEADRFALFDAVATLLRDSARIRPLLIVLDDLHAADESSLLLLRFVAADLRDAAVVAVVTFRPGDVRHDRDLETSLSELVRQNQHVALGGLDAEELGMLADIHGRGQQGEPEDLLRATGGNPFFAIEMLRLRSDGGSRHVPLTVRGTVARRLEQLPPGARRVLEVAAVVGHRFEATLIARVTGSPVQEVAATFEDGVADGLLQFADDGHVRFAHGLVRESVYEGLSPTERALLHTDVLRALEERHSAELERHLAELAHHALVAGEELAGRAIDYAEGAAARAVAQLAFEEAARHYGRAVGAAELVQVDVDRLLALLLAQGDALTAAGDVERARAIFERAADLARSHGRVDLFARAALGYAHMQWDTFASNDRVVVLLREALELLPTKDDPLRSRCLARLGYELSWGSGAGARALGDEALAMARRLGDPSLIAGCLAICRYTRGQDRPVAELLVEVEEALAAARQAGELHTELFLEVVRAGLLIRAGRRGAAEEQIRSHALRAEAQRLPYHRWWAMVHEVLIAVLDGRLDEAMQLSGEAADLGARINPTMAMSVFGPQYWTVLLERNEMEAAFTGFLALPEDVLRPPVMQLGLRMVDAWRGNVEAGRRVLDEFHRDGFAGIPVDATRPGVLNHLATLAVQTGHEPAADRLVELLLPHEHEVVAAGSFMVFNTFAYHLAMLTTMLGRWDDAERHLEDADRMAARLAAPIHIGWARYARAHYLTARGDLDGARAILRDVAGRAASAGHPRLAATAGSELALLGAADADGVAGPTFVLEGDYWTLVTPTGTTRLRASKGLSYVAALVSSPDVDRHVMELASAVGPTSLVTRIDGEGLVAGRPSDLGPVLDARAKAEFRRRIEDLREEVDEAERFHDPERRARAADELDALLGHLAAATGIGGRDRRVGSRVDQTRVNVTKAIRSAIKRISEHDHEVAHHLSVTIRTGTFCAYHPGLDPSRRWTVTVRTSPSPAGAA